MTTSKIPATLGACADALYKTREKRLAKQREVDELAAHEAELREHLIKNLPSSDASGIAGKLARVSVTRKRVPTVKDWDALHAYVVKNAKHGAFALLQKRVNPAAVSEIWDAGKALPGVEAFDSLTLSVVKAGGK